MAQNYYYAVSRIKTLENELLTPGIVLRMLEAENGEESLKFLSETGYRQFLGEVPNVRDFEKILSMGMEDTFYTIDQSTGNKAISKIFRMRHDFNNLKIYLKSHFLGEEHTEILSPYGTIDLKSLKAAIDKDFSQVTKEIEAATVSAFQDFETNNNPQNIDLIVDKMMYRAILEAVSALKMPFFKRYFRTEVDMINLKTFVRVRRMGGDGAFYGETFIEGGFLGVKDFQRFFAESYPQIADILTFSQYGKLSETIRAFGDNGSLTELEKGIDNYLISVVNEGKRAPFGEGPILSYIKAKENENKAIRIIMVGKLNNIPTDMIKGRLRDLYV